jgi:VWFA-related protein
VISVEASMSIGGRFGVLLPILLCSVGAVAQQNAPAAQPEAARPAETVAGRIPLDVVVTPKGGGQPVGGLTEQDFTVLDNKAPQKITSFRAFGGSDAPVEFIIVVDDVNTAYSAVAYERSEIDKFLEANGGHLEYPGQLAIFADTRSQIQSGFSKNGNELSLALQHYTVALRDVTRSAGFYGATDRLSLGIRILHQLAAYGTTLPGRKIVLFISPGWPILSGPGVQLGMKQQQNIFDTIVSLSTELREARMTIYSIDPLGTQDAGLRTFYYQSFLKGIRKPSNTEFGDLALEVIATQTGGQVLKSSNDIAGQIQKAMDDAHAYYELSFDPTPGEPNEYHQIEVKVAKPGLVARTRTGYYSEKR